MREFVIRSRFDAKPRCVGRRQKQQGARRGDGEAAHDGDRHRPEEYRAREWDHGEAGDTQAEMERLASKHGMEQDVKNAHFYRVGWLAVKDLPRLAKAKDRLVNGRAPCPKGCQKRRHPILRRKCDKRETIFQLVKLEWQKRKQAADFWKAAEGQHCCGKMKNCPLK